MQRFSLSSEVADETAVVASKATESAYLGDASWSGPRCNNSHFLRVTLDTLSAYDMT